MCQDKKNNKIQITDNEFKTFLDNRLMRNLKYLISFLNQHNLQYWSAFGTMLGAVRHNGFIPWDDDIDLYMPRADYVKLIELKSQMQDDGFELINYEDNVGYENVFGKFYDLQTTFMEIKKNTYVTGASIDIFPLDYASTNDIKAVVKRQKKYAQKKFLYLLSCFEYDAIDQRICLKERKYLKYFGHIIIKKLLTPNIIFLRNISLRYQKKLILLSEKSDKGLFVLYGGFYAKRDIFPSSWFKETIKMPFEDIEINIPSGYKDYLTHIYGDYMKLPPLEKRRMKHEHFYVNMSKRVSVAEARRRVGEGIIIE